MCPDKKVLSQWYDHELTDTAAEIIKIHVDHCDRCNSLIQVWKNISLSMKKLDRPGDESADRIAAKIKAHHSNSKEIPFFKREIPWTYAAGLVVLFSIGTLVAGLGLSKNSQTGFPMVDFHQGNNGSHFTLDAGDAAKMMTLNQSEDETITINLDTSLSYMGESALIQNVSFEGGAP